MRYLNEVESKGLLQRHGIEVAMPYVVSDVEEAVRKAEELGYPVVLKVVSHVIVHKSDVGGVVLEIKSEDELRRAYVEMLGRLKAMDPEAKVSVQKEYPKGLELVVGVHTDESFGKVMMFGIGGIFVELLKDVSFRLIPLEEKDALEMMEELKAKRLFEGYRGLPKVDKKALARFLLKVADVAEEEAIEQMDLNPVFAYGDRFVVVDARIGLEVG
ncbi:acetyl-CoA synthetase (ADP-forming) [Thermosulfidibacter takaii ABI70S6]|uniref:Acetyl-CoA synthetase (ADP-forming) n=1 Tax=Thermosulfidibacter takaii (strain DSM 17441 / JCM 13301 / NBRC 103674 / ABI70S6) TaxID=1298851 RepID=A0A0S3QU68_THET7|nr:acetate--CoA ligase family protein [Thermosulfidibacter takaii]BAT71883.1 acetyl-CoA synthetase (ADP-forming) [Thermosulfidibacter takaii ABI70S6]